MASYIGASPQQEDADPILVAFAAEAAKGDPASPEARELVLSLIPQGASVGLGGSMTIRELNLVEALEKRGSQVWWHWTSPEERLTVYENARKADVYLASSNAVTRDGRIVNIDGQANRVAGMIQGPSRVILVIGEQKVVDGGLNTAIARIRAQACPANAKRLKLHTPCALTGVCNQAECGDDCMCRVTAVLERPPRGREITVIFTEEALGY